MRSVRLIRRGLILALVFAIAGLFYWHTFHNDRVLARGAASVTLLSRAHTIDKLFMSMTGPHSNHADVRLGDTGDDRLYWIVGLSSELVSQNGETKISPEYFCHSNLVFNPSRLSDKRNPDCPFTHSGDGRLFTLVPGRMSIQLPDGFGLPVYGDESLDYFSMSLNLNDKTGSRKVRFKTNVKFVPDDALPKGEKFHPLFRRAVYGYEPIDGESPHSVCSGGDHPGAACGPFIGKAATNSFHESLGKTNTVHWMIPPGTYESRVPVTPQLDLPYDTTVHYVTAHLHPFGKSVSLVDQTTGQTLFTITSTDYADKLGVEYMSEIAIPTGIELKRDHTYELVTKYENTTTGPIDAMSIMYLYCLDQKFESRLP